MAAVDSLLLDAKGKEVLLECYPDGEILFWSDDGIHLEFDRKQTALIIAALRKQEKLPKLARDSVQVEVSSPQLRQQPAVTPVATSRAAPAATASPRRQHNRQVAKEGPGWGATVLVDLKPHRYYYDKRDQAREAEGSHRIGEAGRIA
jgi:hypothetical protein